jgi:hypothetical protein
MEAAAPFLDAALNNLMPTVAVPSAAVPAGMTAAPTSAPAGGATGRLRLISGELTLDESGRAFIDGVAVESDDADDDYDDLLGRMN